MTHAIKRDTIQEHQVLIRTSSAHIKTRSAFSSGLNTGKELQAFHQVHLTTNGRQPFNLINGDFHFGHLDLVLNAVESFPCDHRFANGDARTERKVNLDVLVQFDLKFARRVSGIGDQEVVHPSSKRERIKTIRVGPRTYGLIRAPYRCPH